jgi:hypothetical protein
MVENGQLRREFLDQDRRFRSNHSTVFAGLRGRARRCGQRHLDSVEPSFE